MSSPPSHCTPRPSHSIPSLSPSLLTAGSLEITILPQNRHPRPNPTPPSPRPPSGRWPCPPSAGNESILAADMLAGCPAQRSMRGRDGLGLRSTGQEEASSRLKLAGRKPMVERALIQPVTISPVKSTAYLVKYIQTFERWRGARLMMLQSPVSYN